MNTESRKDNINTDSQSQEGYKAWYQAYGNKVFDPAAFRNDPDEISRLREFVKVRSYVRDHYGEMPVRSKI